MMFLFERSAKAGIAAVALALCLASGTAWAITSDHANDTVSFKKNMKQFPPFCKNGEVIDHTGIKYECKDNSGKAACPEGALRVLKADGESFECVVDKDLNTTCNSDEAMQIPSETGTPTCVPTVGTPPICGLDQVLTSMDGKKFICMPTTASFTINTDDLRFIHGWCNSQTVLDSAPLFEGVTIFSGWCQSACKRFCTNLTFYGISLFGGGYITESSGPSTQCSCVR